MFWQFLQNISGQIINFSVTVVLARLLMPDDYGVVALAGMFLGLLGIFVDGGLAPALVQKKNADEMDFDTMFVTQLVFSSCVYAIVYFTAPYFADWFHSNQLTSLIRVMALTMPLGALGGVQYCVVTRRMMFRWFFYASLSSLIVSAVVGLYMAYAGFGAWALVGQKMSAVIVSTAVIFFLLDWHPSFRFSYTRFRALFSEGLKFMGTTLIGTVTAQVRGYVIGLKYTAADLAYYNRGGGLPDMLRNNVDNTIQSALYPALTKIQDDTDAVRHALSRSMRTSTFLLFPMLLGLSAVADKVVVILYGERWAMAVPYMQLICFSHAIAVLCNVNIQALRATGHIGTILKLEFIKKPIMLLMILGTAMISPLAIAWGMIFFNIFVYFVNSYPNKKYINYSYLEQLKDVGPNIILSLTMFILVISIGHLNIMNTYLLLFVQVFTGIIFYLCIAYLFKNESFSYAYHYAKDFFKRKVQKG